MKKGLFLLFAWVVLAGQAASAAQPAADDKPDAQLSALYEKAMALEGKLELTRAEELYNEIVRRSDADRQWALWRGARHGLRRVKRQRAEFTLTRAELEKKLAATFSDYKPAEFDQWEKRGWILSRVVDGKRGYSIMNPTNLCFFDTQMMARHKSRAKGYRDFAQIFLDESALLDRLRSESTVPRRSVAPMRFLLTYKVEIQQADLPPGKTVRAWLPYPLLTPAVQNIRTLSVVPDGALKHCPDVEGEIGIAYLEFDRPKKDDVVIEMKVAFHSYDTDYVIDADAIPSYDEQGELYRRFTRSEQQINLTEPLCELARSVVGREKNPYRKARKLYDWVCDNVKYNFVWRWRDATFTFGCASEEVRERRIGDCVIQSVFYAALCRAVGVPARVCNGPIFPPGMRNDHVWAEVYFPKYGWAPVDVTYSEVASMVPGLSDAQRRRIRDFFFCRMDRYRFWTQRSDLVGELVPRKRSPRYTVTMFVRPELECGGQDVEKRKITWSCLPETPDAKTQAGTPDS